MIEGRAINWTKVSLIFSWPEDPTNEGDIQAHPLYSEPLSASIPKSYVAAWSGCDFAILSLQSAIPAVIQAYHCKAAHPVATAYKRRDVIVQAQKSVMSLCRPGGSQGVQGASLQG